MSNLEIFQRSDRRWGWRIRAENGAIVATDGSQGYERRGDCARTGRAVLSGAYGDDTVTDRLDRIREHLTWWERADRPHTDGRALATAIRSIIDATLG